MIRDREDLIEEELGFYTILFKAEKEINLSADIL